MLRLFLLLLVAIPVAARQSGSPSDWTIYIANDACSDYTWGFSEPQTRQAFADLVLGHLEMMKRTDHLAPENQDRYNMSVTEEARCFLERYPERRDELIRRIKEGRIFVSPFLNNSMWAFQSVESLIRTLYPARRLQKEWGFPLDVAEHIEHPALPWGVASVLTGCGIRWLSVPFYKYDSTFDKLTNPPLFVFEGPDGERLRVIMDSWASKKSHYTQGGWLLRDPKRIAGEWVPHYASLGDAYPLRATLASGTHGDTSPTSGAQAHAFATQIERYNARAGGKPKLVNATLRQFCQAVDEAETSKPFLKTIRGCFGHSWDLWPVSLAKYVAGMREGDRRLLAAEALLAMSSNARAVEGTRAACERAEWLWTMLADHAWNGSNDANKVVNAELRRKWDEELAGAAGKLTQEGWAALGLRADEGTITVFNPLSVPRRDPVRVEAGVAVASLPSQVVEEDGRRVLYFVPPTIEGFGFQSFALAASAASRSSRLQATPDGLSGPFYRLKVDPKTGGLASLVHVPTGVELMNGKSDYAFGETVYFDGQEHRLNGAKTAVIAAGPVLARLRVSGRMPGLSVISSITIYADLDQVDFDFRIHKHVTTHKQRITQVFPILLPGAVTRIETTGAIVRPYPQPQGDLLAGADTTRFAVQGFVDASPPNGPGVTIAPLDAFLLRQDLTSLTFEPIGNDQNYEEVTRDQHGVNDFRFRYSVRVHRGGFNSPDALEWSRRAASPFVVGLGRLPALPKPGPRVSSSRAIATSLKPSEDGPAGSVSLRLWETSGRTGTLEIAAGGYRKAVRTDLLERELSALPITNGKLSLPLRAHGFAAVRLIP